MKKNNIKLIKKQVLGLAFTAFFLTIAWATSYDDDQELIDLPITALANESGITLYNSSEITLDSANLILNGIYSAENITLEQESETLVEFIEFKDKDGAGLPNNEPADVLEIFFPKLPDSISYYSNPYLRINLNN